MCPLARGWPSNSDARLVGHGALPDRRVSERPRLTRSVCRKHAATSRLRSYADCVAWLHAI